MKKASPSGEEFCTSPPEGFSGSSPILLMLRHLTVRGIVAALARALHSLFP
jgi:hypothetical protein